MRIFIICSLLLLSAAGAFAQQFRPTVVRDGARLYVSETYDLYQWYKDGSAITNAVEREYYPTEAGTYTADVTCSSKSFSFTGVNEPAWAADFTVNPNPAGDDVRLNLPAGNWNVRVVTMQGQVVLNREMNANGSPQTLSTAELSTGVYIMQVEGSQGRVTRRFLKQ